MRMVISLFVMVALVGVVGLVINSTDTSTTAQITRPHSPSCAWLHPDAPPCEFAEYGCPGEEGQYKAKTFMFRQETPICCCIPQW
ncbi:hypothetical protein HY490_03150 [Candidatus Woesearchaeota archaeon]|nr:hypothetical protein [Candidatus Woesearchaeota archaeon]